MTLPGNDVLDTLVLFRKWFPSAERHSLEVVAEHVGVKIKGRHRALGDARCLYEVFSHGLARLPSSRTLKDLMSIKGVVVRFE